MAPANSTIMALFASNRRDGRWQVSKKTAVRSLFGKCSIDLREAHAEEELEELNFNVLSILGSVTIIVPEGLDIQPSGTAVLASASCHVPTTDQRAELQTVLVDSLTILGKLRIRIAEDDEPEPDAERRTKKSRKGESISKGSRRTRGKDDAAAAEPAVEPEPRLVDPEFAEAARRAAIEAEVAEWERATGLAEAAGVDVDPAHRPLVDEVGTARPDTDSPAHGAAAPVTPAADDAAIPPAHVAAPGPTVVARQPGPTVVATEPATTPSAAPTADTPAPGTLDGAATTPTPEATSAMEVLAQRPDLDETAVAPEPRTVSAENPAPPGPRVVGAADDVAAPE